MTKSAAFAILLCLLPISSSIVYADPALVPARVASPAVPQRRPVAPEPRSSADSSVTEPVFRRWVAGARAADSATVMRLNARRVEAPDAPGNAHTRWETSIAAQGPVGRAWIDSLLVLMVRSRSFDPGRRCDLGAYPNVGEELLVFGIRFANPVTNPSIFLPMAEQCLGLRENDRNVGRVDVARIQAPLLDLLRSALPGDAMLFGSGTTHSASPASPSLSRSTRPAFGEYVYVEELPEALTKVPPEYPDEARKAGVDGTVMLQALVGTGGDVEDVRVQKSVPMLDAAAIAAVRQWHFKPGRTKTEPVAVWVAIPIKFSLH